MVRFGVAGYPPQFYNSIYKKDRLKIFNWLKDLGLNAFEAQMTYGPRTSIDNCKLMASISKDFDIKISIHASYFIVFTSGDQNKINKSNDTLLKTYELASYLNSEVIVLHPGALYNATPEIAIDRMRDNLCNFFNRLGKSETGLFLETAGKLGQLGSVDEIFKLVSGFDRCFPCIDFGHVHARTLGGLSERKQIDNLFYHLDELGAFSRKSKIHFHYTPIHYGRRGEIVHKAIDDKYELPPSLFDEPDKEPQLFHPRFDQIIKNISKYDLEKCTIISETHNSQEQGALAMQNLYTKLIYD